MFLGPNAVSAVCSELLITYRGFRSFLTELSGQNY
jgi:hypothetical protein